MIEIPLDKHWNNDLSKNNDSISDNIHYLEGIGVIWLQFGAISKTFLRQSCWWHLNGSSRHEPTDGQVAPGNSWCSRLSWRPLFGVITRLAGFLFRKFYFFLFWRFICCVGQSWGFIVMQYSVSIMRYRLDFRSLCQAW